MVNIICQITNSMKSILVQISAFRPVALFFSGEMRDGIHIYGMLFYITRSVGFRIILHLI